MTKLKATTKATSAAKRTFEVIVKAYKAVLIEAESTQEAEEIASEECTSFNWEIDSWRAEELLRPHGIEAAKRHGAVYVDEWNG